MRPRKLKGRNVEFEKGNMRTIGLMLAKMDSMTHQLDWETRLLSQELTQCAATYIKRSGKVGEKNR